MSEAGEAVEPSAPRPGVQAGLVVLVALALYAPTLAAGFVYDDYPLVEINPWIRSASTLGEVFTQGLFDFNPNHSGSASFYRPLVHVLLLGVHAAAGTAAWAYHLVPVLLHAAAALMLWALARRLLPDSARGGALVAGLLFAVHPVHVEAVAWVSALMDLSATTAGLGMLWLLTTRSLRPSRAVAGAALWLVALLFKEVASVLPLMLAAWAWATAEGEGSGGGRERAWRWGPLAVVAAVYLGLRLGAVGWGVTNSGWSAVPGGVALLNALPLLADYARLLLLPSGLSIFHAFEPATSLVDARVVAGLGGALVLLALLVSLRRRAPAAWLGLAWMVLPLLPALHLRALGESAVSERYAYLPSVGFCLVLGAAWTAWARGAAGRSRPWLPVAAAAAVVVAGASQTAVQVGVWRDEVSLWTNAVEVEPEAPTPLYQLGSALLRGGDAETAALFLGRAVMARPDFPPAVNDLASALLGSGQPGRARELLEVALRGRPDQAGYHWHLGQALRAQGDAEGAVRSFREAARLGASSVDVRVDLGESLLGLGRAEEALLPLEEARRLRPTEPRVLQALARAQRALGHEAAAREHEAAAGRATTSAP